MQKPKRSKKDQLNQELQDLESRLASLSPGLSHFDQLPLSHPTAKGLAQAHYVQMTAIQQQSLPISLSQRDVLGAAKTGSGKTLAFLIPALEILYRAKWTPLDQLGVLILSPTRELVLQKIGKFHSFSAGLLIGGKDLKQEQERVARMNILVCTPGRLLQHMDQTPDFSCDQLQLLGTFLDGLILLVLDEADRCLDCGFEKTLNAILENLPKKRQTLLFSATQTKSVRDLARLSLVDPEYVAVHESSETSTPQNLLQKYVVVELPQKLDLLFSFLKTHLKQKIIVFVSSCKQVRFIYETFCKLQPGIPLYNLFGKQKQAKRMAIFDQFCRKQAACLFATDVAARGLDFPAVDWVLQLDCPEDAETYIHRVGRTARYESSGDALLFLLPSEEPGMLKEFERKKIPVQKIKINPSKTISVSHQLQAFCSQSPEIKYLGQKSFISYMRSVYLQKNKLVFDVTALPAEAFAESLGLPGAPKISFVKKSEKKNEPRLKAAEDDEGVESNDLTPLSGRSKIDKMFNKKNLTILSDHYAKLKTSDTEDGTDVSDKDDDAFLTLKRADHDVDLLPDTKAPEAALTHKQILKTKQKELKKRGSGQKFIFNDDGEVSLTLSTHTQAMLSYQLESLTDFQKEQALADRTKAYLDAKREQMQKADATDKAIQKERLRERKLERKRKEKAVRREQSGPVTGVSLGHGSEVSESGSDQDDAYDEHAGEFGDASTDSEPLDINLDESDSDSPQTPPPKKRCVEAKTSTAKKPKVAISTLSKQSLEDMALSLLQSK